MHIIHIIKKKKKQRCLSLS